MPKDQTNEKQRHPKHDLVQVVFIMFLTIIGVRYPWSFFNLLNKTDSLRGLFVTYLKHWLFNWWMLGNVAWILHNTLTSIAKDAIGGWWHKGVISGCYLQVKCRLCRTLPNQTVRWNSCKWMACNAQPIYLSCEASELDLTSSSIQNLWHHQQKNLLKNAQNIAYKVLGEGWLPIEATRDRTMLVTKMTTLASPMSVDERAGSHRTTIRGVSSGGTKDETSSGGTGDEMSSGGTMDEMSSGGSYGTFRTLLSVFQFPSNSTWSGSRYNAQSKTLQSTCPIKNRVCWDFQCDIRYDIFN